MSRKRIKPKFSPSLWGETWLLYLLLSFDSPQRPGCVAPADLLGVSQSFISNTSIGEKKEEAVCVCQGCSLGGGSGL